MDKYKIGHTPGYDCNFHEDPFTCFEGDLSGKHGLLNITQYKANLRFIETQLSIEDIVSRTVVIYGANENNEIMPFCATFVDGKLKIFYFLKDAYQLLWKSVPIFYHIPPSSLLFTKIMKDVGLSFKNISDFF